MALKIWKDGSMQKIDTSLHKPVIFINGAKKVLEKAYTFVNGEKYEIWGSGGVQVDYISSTGTLGGGTPFAISENWVNCFYNNVIFRIDISNLSNPILIDQTSCGNINRYNNYQSTASNKIFSAWNNGSRTGYKLKMDNSTGIISILSFSTITATSSATNLTSLLGVTNNYLVNQFSTLVSMRPTQVWNRYIYWNNMQKYTTGYTNCSYYFQDSDDTFIGYRNGLHRFSASGTTDLGISGFPAVSIFDDGTYIYATKNNTTVHKRAINDLGTDLYTYTISDTNYKICLLGQNGNYYIVYKYQTIQVSKIQTQL